MKRSKAQEYVRRIQTVEYSVSILGVDILTDLSKINEVNYNSVLDKASAILTKWKMRNLSLCGKVVVVNTMVASLFTYKMQVLPLMKKTHVEKFNKLVQDFLWNGRKPKILLKNLQLEKHQGGLKLVDIVKKDKALKLSWLKWLHEDEFLAQHAYQKLSLVLAQQIWKCNLKTNDIEALFGKSFWRDVLSCWAEINFQKDENYVTIMKQMIWYNSNIRINNKPFIFKKACLEGLMYVCQLFNQDGTILPADHFVRFYNCNVMQANMLISAIPKRWKAVVMDCYLGKRHSGTLVIIYPLLCNISLNIKVKQ